MGIFSKRGESTRRAEQPPRLVARETHRLLHAK
jgi:hypothetical protein